jgi:membrane peptidoglycan carboxypeptidase
VALTAIINSPNNLDPGRGEAQRSDLMERYQYVLNQMVKLKYITEDQRASSTPRCPTSRPSIRPSRAGAGPRGTC